jgi:hypothetical protein
MRWQSEFRCTVLYRECATGRSESAVYFVDATDRGSAKAWAHHRFLADNESALEKGNIALLSVNAEKVGEQASFAF